MIGKMMKKIFTNSQRKNKSTFLKNFPKILIKKNKTIKKSGWSFHLEKEMFLESEYYTEKSYKTKDLFNLLRVRTFTGKTSFFKKRKYEIRMKIYKVKK